MAIKKKRVTKKKPTRDVPALEDIVLQLSEHKFGSKIWYKPECIRTTAILELMQRKCFVRNDFEKLKTTLTLLGLKAKVVIVHTKIEL